MIPYDELDRALQKWKARSQNAAADAAREFEESGRVAAGSVPGAVESLPPPSDQTGEIDLGDSVVESYEEAE
jgi:hypothetical protein